MNGRRGRKETTQQHAAATGDSGDPLPQLLPGVVGPARVVALGTASVAPAGAVVGGLAVVVATAGFAAPLIVVLAFLASICCALSIGELAQRLPSAGSLYTYASHGLGPSLGFLTGWMLVFAYLAYVPAVLGLASVYLGQLFRDATGFFAAEWVVFAVLATALAVISYLGIRISTAIDLTLVVAEMAVILALAITMVAKSGLGHRPLEAFSPASVPHGLHAELLTAMIFGITAFAGYEAAATLGEESRNPRHTIPWSLRGVVALVGAFYLTVVFAEVTAVGRDGVAVLAAQPNPLGYLADVYWSPSTRWVVDLAVGVTCLGFVLAAFNAAVRIIFAMSRERALPVPAARLSRRGTPVVAILALAAATLALGLPMTRFMGGGRTFACLAGAGGLSIILVYMTVNLATIRAFRREFIGERDLWRHQIIPSVAVVLMAVPLWGLALDRSLRPERLAPYVALVWLVGGLVVVARLRTRHPDRFSGLGALFVPGQSLTSDGHRPTASVGVGRAAASPPTSRPSRPSWPSWPPWRRT